MIFVRIQNNSRCDKWKHSTLSSITAVTSDLVETVTYETETKPETFETETRKNGFDPAAGINEYLLHFCDEPKKSYLLYFV